MGLRQPKKVISFAGLDTINPDWLNLAAVIQQTRVTGQGNKMNFSGDFIAVGNLERGSWYVDVNQTVLEKPDSWRFRELQYYRKTDELDVVIGSQPTFWQNQSGGDFWE